MARYLDAPVTTLAGMPEESRRGWIAADQGEFAVVTVEMHEKTGSLRALFLEIADAFDELARVARHWVHSVNMLGAALLTQVVALQVLRRYPRPPSRLAGT
ncbi:hypothetical protein ACFQYP_21760 [Nonomuraea antimicrobica]